MQRTKLGFEAANYIRDNRDLIPDVLAGLLLIEETETPVGTKHADFYILEVLNHLIFYRWLSKTNKWVIIVKPKG